MINKTVKDYMEMKTERGTFIPVGSKAVGQTIQDVEKYGVKVEGYYQNPATFDQILKPEPSIELMVGMGLVIKGQRSRIKNLCEALDLP
jgi:rhamnose utilization protein RhaD (predicted bifunctional aldolase and dehydrogenase)